MIAMFQKVEWQTKQGDLDALAYFFNVTWEAVGVGKVYGSRVSVTAFFGFGVRDSDLHFSRVKAWGHVRVYELGFFCI